MSALPNYDLEPWLQEWERKAMEKAKVTIENVDLRARLSSAEGQRDAWMRRCEAAEVRCAQLEDGAINARINTENVAKLAASERRVAELETALTKVSAIRDSIVGAQSFNWSEHAYPLVAVLDEAGFKGAGYQIARANLGTLLARLAEAERLLRDWARGQERNVASLPTETRAFLAASSPGAERPTGCACGAYKFDTKWPPGHSVNGCGK